MSTVVKAQDLAHRGTSHSVIVWLPCLPLMTAADRVATVKQALRGQ